MNKRRWLVALGLSAAAQAWAGAAGAAATAAAGDAVPAAGAFADLHDFTGTDGAMPYTGLTLGSDGVLRGTTQGTTSLPGSVYSITTGGRIKVLHTFDGGPEGWYPLGEVVEGPDGAWYGTTDAGGASGAGTVFRLDRRGNLSVLHTFTPEDGVDGNAPSTRLLLASDGNFYGTTWNGGTNDAGTVFRISPTGQYAVMHAFGGAGEGSNPNAPLIQAGDGRLYGTTSWESRFGAGTVFSITLDGVATVLHTFDGSDGFYAAGLIQARDGNFYGTTDGGRGLPGTAYRMAADGTVTVLHSFPWSTQPEGYAPVGSLLQAANGWFYGVTQRGGGSGFGTVFRMKPNGDVTVLHTFTDGNTGACTLVQARDGMLYGTSWGGANNVGYVYRLPAR